VGTEVDLSYDSHSLAFFLSGASQQDEAPPSRLRENSVLYRTREWNLTYGAEIKIIAGCSKRPSSKATASEEARRTLQYVEPLSGARTPLADFFSMLLGDDQRLLGRTAVHGPGRLGIGLAAGHRYEPAQP
jgi:hypothetical protein